MSVSILLLLMSLGDPASGPLEGASVPAELLRVVEHQTMGIRPEEAGLYYSILAALRDADPSAMRERARAIEQQRLPEYARRLRPEEGFPTFYDVFQHPEVWHGEPVSLRGHVRKWQEIPAGVNDFGLESLYELWLYTSDSQTNPAVVICTEIPADLPPITERNELVDQISVTGILFKMYGYRAQDGNRRIAPLLLARNVTWEPVPDRSDRQALSPVSLIALLALMCALFYALWRLGLAGQRRRPLPGAEPPSDAGPPEFPDESPPPTDADSR